MKSYLVDVEDALSHASSFRVKKGGDPPYELMPVEVLRKVVAWANSRTETENYGYTIEGLVSAWTNEMAEEGAEVEVP